jgi:hypothetical protein
MSATAEAGARRDKLASAAAATTRPLTRPLLLAAFLVWVFLGVASGWTSGAAVPIAWALIGAYLVPTGLVLEMGRRIPLGSGVTPAILLRSLLLGSLLGAVAMTTIGDGFGRMLTGVPWWIPALVLPAAAETLAIAAVVRLIGRRVEASSRAGLFLGGALGAGFGAFAALGAVLRSLAALTGTPLPPAMPPSVLIEAAVTAQHAALLPLTSPVWGALVGAAVFASRGLLLRALAGVMLAHAVVLALVTLAGGLLGTSPAALVVQLALAAAAATPAALVWRRTARRLAAADQAGGA